MLSVHAALWRVECESDLVSADRCCYSPAAPLFYPSLLLCERLVTLSRKPPVFIARRFRLIAAAALLACVSQSGCAPNGSVIRRLTIISDPPGAMVYVDEEPIGATPCSVSYIYYATRKIRLVKDGYATRTVMQEFPTPWYQYIPLDFVSENVSPWEIRDERTVEFKLSPQAIVPVEQILQRGEELRRTVRGQSLPGAGVPGAIVPQGAPGIPSNSPPFRLDLGQQPGSPAR